MTDKEIQEQLEALRIVGERLRSEGPEACRLFLREAGIADDEGAAPSPAAPEPERGEGGFDRKIIDGMMRAQFGSPDISRLIDEHYKQYFSRYKSYQEKFTYLEWYHIFLDFADKLEEYYRPRPSPQPTTSREEKEFTRRQVKEILLQVSDDPGLSNLSINDWIDRFYPPPPLTVNDVEGEAPEKMSNQLAAEADMAAIEYGKQQGFDVLNECGDRMVDYNIAADLTDAFEAGQNWMWRKMQEENRRHENARNRAQGRCLELRKELRAVNARIESLTEELAIVQQFRDNVAEERDALKLSIQKLATYFNEEGYSGIAHRINGLLTADTAERREGR